MGSERELRSHQKKTQQPQSRSTVRTRLLWAGIVRKQFFRVALGLFVGMNAIAALLAYPATHLKPRGHFGLGAPRPENSRQPSDLGLAYVTQRIPLNQNEWLETWLIPTQRSTARGTVLLFPGHLAAKGGLLLNTAQDFSRLGYNALLIDFRGVGGSSGNKTTIGFKEAKDVAAAIHYAQQQKLTAPIVLYGISMGSAAVLRSVAVENVNPGGIILELPFARLVDTVKSRLRYRKIPPVPVAELIVLWGSLQHGFNGFAHNPVAYAKDVRCPVLLLHGQRDPWTSVAEIEEIFQNFPGPKTLVIEPKAGHQRLVGANPQLWYDQVRQFLDAV